MFYSKVLTNYYLYVINIIFFHFFNHRNFLPQNREYYWQTINPFPLSGFVRMCINLVYERMHKYIHAQQRLMLISRRKKKVYLIIQII